MAGRPSHAPSIKRDVMKKGSKRIKKKKKRSGKKGKIKKKPQKGLKKGVKRVGKKLGLKKHKNNSLRKHKRIMKRLSHCAEPRRSSINPGEERNSTVNPGGPRMSGGQSRGSLLGNHVKPFWANKGKKPAALNQFMKGQRGKAPVRRGGVVLPNFAAKFNRLRQQRGK